MTLHNTLLCTHPIFRESDNLMRLKILVFLLFCVSSVCFAEECMDVSKDIGEIKDNMPHVEKMAKNVGGSVDQAELDSLFGYMFGVRLFKKTEDLEFCMRMNDKKLEHSVRAKDGSIKQRWSKTNVGS